MGEICENTIIVEDIDSFELKKINEGVVTVWVSWSPGFISSLQVIKYLYSVNYSGTFYVVDNDDFNNPEKNADLFGKVLHGWGEIFIIRDGMIKDEFLGKESFYKFKRYFNAISPKGKSYSLSQSIQPITQR